MKVTCVVDDRALADSGFKSEHGASFLIESAGRYVLFDTGSSASVLLHNLAVLGFAPGRIEALILSHGHNDHTGGLAGLLAQVPGLPLYAHPDLFRERFRKTGTGFKKVGPSMDRAALQDLADVRLSAEPLEVIPGVWALGEISPRVEPEGRSKKHVIREGAGWAADPYRDDLSIVLKTGQGLVLVCGCCHAGLLNTLARVRSIFDRDAVAVVGGTHLVSADAGMMAGIVEKLQTYGPPRFWVGHCTGDLAFDALRGAFGEKVSPCQAGTELAF
jgi:7,8-dihydropterin-6-yl-methyl-4-(beta-D-ribofuranosyl)aminobenzene 5'-phosphate synthase